MAILIAFYSRAGENYFGGAHRRVSTGNTERAAKMLADITGGALYKIEQARPYSDDYDTCTAEAKADLRANARPEVLDMPEDLDAYDKIYLGYPNYWGTMPMAVYTFLESYDLAGKTIHPFCTHEGSGLSRTEQEFVAYMNAYGYDVKWEPHQKYITYTTPENIRCRDSKLFDQTLKRENMELYFRLGGADYLQACREIAYDHREPTPTLEDVVCGMAGTVAAICALCEDENSEVSDLARELYYSSLLLQELVEWYQSRRQEQENYEEEYEQYHGFDMTMM